MTELEAIKKIGQSIRLTRYIYVGVCVKSERELFYRALRFGG